MQIKTVPYEMLVRWNADGILAGASFATRTVYSEDGAILFDKIADPIPVGLDQDADLPVAEVLTPENLDAIRSVNQIAGERDAIAAERDILATERNQLARMLSSVLAELDVLRRQAIHGGAASIASEVR